jgi:hypothetical protein
MIREACTLCGIVPHFYQGLDSQKQRRACGLVACQKLGFLRDLLEFRTRKIWQLGHDFIETHLQILAHLGRVTTLNVTLNSATAAPKASHCAVGSHLNRDHSTSSRLHRPARSKTNGSLVRLLVPPLPPPLKLRRMPFLPSPAAMATCGGTVSSVSIFPAIIQRPKAGNQRPGS